MEKKSKIWDNERTFGKFYNYSKSLGLDIIVQCYPTFDEDSSIYFPQMNELNQKINLDEISMGMSDYLNAIEFKSTFKNWI